jgi:hypothetical protein
MTNISREEQLHLDAIIARIVDERGNGNDWRAIVEYRNKFGNDVVMKAAQDAAFNLRKSRVTVPSSNRPRASKRP